MAIQLNDKAVAFARQLIQQGNVDKEDDWSAHQPTPETENEFLADHSYDEYGNWFLGINPDASPETKELYEFPYGNFQKVCRAGLIAAEQRAGQYHHEEIKNAARELLELIG